MAIDFKSMTAKELEKLLADVKKALQSARARDQRAARKAAEQAAAKYGFSLAELSDAPAKPKKAAKAKPRKSAKPKFANPADASQTWTGKGRQPQWYKDAVAAGKAPADLAI